MVEWPGHSWRGLFADSVQPAPHNVLRPSRRWRRLPSRLAVNKPILRSVPTTGWDKFAGISQWMHPMGQVLMTAIRYCGNPMESEVVAQRGGIVQQEPSRDTWTEIQAQHCCSLIASHIHLHQMITPRDTLPLLAEMNHFLERACLFGAYVLSYLPVSSPFAVILAQMEMVFCDMRPAFKFWWIPL